MYLFHFELFAEAISFQINDLEIIVSNFASFIRAIACHTFVSGYGNRSPVGSSRMRFKPWPRSTGMPWIRRGMTITSVINCAHSRGRTFAIRAHLSATREKCVPRTICIRGVSTISTNFMPSFVAREKCNGEIWKFFEKECFFFL